MNRPLGSATPFALSVVVGSGLLATCFSAEAATTVYELAQVTHFHGLAVDPADRSRLYLATHHGLFLLEPDGAAHPVSEVPYDLMSFTPHPNARSTLYASGHPASGGNLGFIVSTDDGRSWRRVSSGVGGPVDFHQLAISGADPKTIYGADARALQVSKDQGRSWEFVGPAPEGLVDLAASSKDPSMLYAATQSGLLKSGDGGGSWQDAYWLRQPATMVHVTPVGVVYAFIVGAGLISTVEPKLGWRRVNEHGFGDNLLLHLVVDPTRPSKLYAISFDLQSKAQSVLASNDAGKNWAPLGSTIH